MPIVAPSLLASDFLNLKGEIVNLNESGVEWLHFDVMDGHFVPNLTFGAAILKQIKTCTNLFLDVHFMVNDVFLFLDAFVDAGADGITVHIENTPHIHKAIMHIKNKGVKAGVVLNPGTPLSALDSILPFVDYVLLMSVNPGFGGQLFITETVDKVRLLKEKIKTYSNNILISVDGGINRETAPLVVNAGCDILVVGQAFFGKGETLYKQEYEYYRSL